MVMQHAFLVHMVLVMGLTEPSAQWHLYLEAF